MKLKNTTGWPDYFLRRMVLWCCRQIELPARSLRLATFGNRSSGAWSGHGCSWKILVRIGPESEFPVEPFHYPGRTNDAFLNPRVTDRLEALIAVTAHELTHTLQHRHLNTLPAIRAIRRGYYSERKTMHNERMVLESFRANRDALLAEWSRPVERTAKPKPSVQERRAIKAANDLARWQRKLKLAQTKCRKLKQLVKYYDKALAARRSPTERVGVGP